MCLGDAKLGQMSQNGKLQPQLNPQSTRELNMTVLQRIDRHVEEILTTAAHVTLYEFNIELSNWSRKDVEGSLFVVKRRTQPRFQFIVMNRRSTENLVENLLGGFEYEVQVPYLLYCNASQEVNGIWFYNPRECEEVAKIFSRILNAFAKVPTKPKLFTSQSSEFQELEAVPTSATVDGPLEASESVSSVSEASEEPLEHFFNNSIHLGSADLSVSTPTCSSTVTPPMTVYAASATSPTLYPMPVQSPKASTSVSLSPITSLSLDMPEITNMSCTTLLKPSFFVPPSLPSTSAHPPLIPPAPLQPSHGAPLLQPFPPPVPPPSLAPPSSTSELIITRDGVRDALLQLVQKEHFVDMVYREMMNACMP
eukprot:c28592_g2_i1 orf=435-1535(+)